MSTAASAAEELRRRSAKKALLRIRRDPVKFCETVLGDHMWSKQREILESVRDNKRTAVRSCHGVGKTATAARAFLWWMAAFAPHAMVVTTAPTWRQVRDLLWREIAKAYGQSGGFFDGKLTETRLDFAPDWFAVGLSTRQPENFQGYHSENLLFIGDEASGIMPPIFEAAEGFLTAGNARVLLIGNPTQVTGQFYDAFHRERALWNTIHISAADSPAFTGEEVPDRLARVLISRDWVEEKEVKWGAESPLYHVRVLGNFPKQGDRNVVSLVHIENAQNRDLEAEWPHFISCDVARFGNDETVIAGRQGKKVEILRVIHGADTVAVAAAVLEEADKYCSDIHGKPKIVVDDVGVGGGVTDQLRASNRGYSVVGYNAGAAPAEKNQGEGGYPNARSELWFEFAEDWLPDLDLPVDDQLAQDLLAPEYSYDSKMRRVVEPKDETKKRLGRSPDRADAVLMLFSRAALSAASTVVPQGLSQPGGSKWRR
jgi:phage terminase large subunit